MTIQSVQVRPVLFAVAFGVLLSSATAGAAEGGTSDADEARAYHEKAKAAFALSHYAQAAEFFEKAFELKSDPALLYNAAQSHRLAGNKQRALTLYQNYLRVYGRDERRPQIELRIDELKKSIDKDRSEVPVPPPAGWPPGTSGPGAGAKAGASTPPNLRAAEPARPLTPPPPAPAPPAPASPAPIALAPMPTTPPPPAVTLTSSPPPSATLVTQANSSGEASGNDEGLTHKPWFWIAVGGGVAAAVTVVLLLTLSKATDPSASYGKISGN
jgi:tetratricopeptide (TPR) repeat protein